MFDILLSIKQQFLKIPRIFTWNAPTVSCNGSRPDSKVNKSSVQAWFRSTFVALQSTSNLVLGAIYVPARDEPHHTKHSLQCSLFVERQQIPWEGASASCTKHSYRTEAHPH